MITSYNFQIRHLAGFFCCLLITVAVVPLLSGAEEDVLLSAMRDELKRSTEQLKLEEMEKPYFIEYAVQDSERYRIEAVFGSLTQSDHSTDRTFRVDVRVGNYKLDNSEFISQRSMFAFYRNMNRGLVLENDYAALRRDLWLATDSAYKKALEELAQKQSFMETHLQSEEVPDFSREEARQLIEPRAVLTLDQSKWEGVLRRLSAIFREFPAIHSSEVSLRVELTNKYLLNSEGTECRSPAVSVALIAHAATQVEDGNRLKHHVPFYRGSLDTLPDETLLATAIRTMAAELTALTTAPVLDEYYGPAIFAGPASAELFGQLFAAQLSGARPPLFEDQRMAAMGGGRNQLVGRLNRRVLPSFFTVIDDPTQEREEKTPLIGGYPIDDQGVPAQTVTIVENGVLKNMLMSRRPSEDFSSSNGHGRAIHSMAPGPQISNLLIRASESMSEEELKQELLGLCRDQGLSHGLIIRLLDNPGITGRDDSMASMMSMMSGGGGSMLTSPTLAYRVSVEDGSEELVRGVVLGGLSVSTLKDIIAAGSEYTVANRLAASGGGPMGMMFSFIGPMGSMGNQGIPTSVVAPAVLLEEIELIEQRDTTSKPTLLEHPYFAD